MDRSFILVSAIVALVLTVPCGTVYAELQACVGPDGPAANQCDDSGCLIDMVVVYTAAAATQAANNGRSIVDEIYLAGDLVNQSLQNSDIAMFLRIVATAQVDMDETQYTSMTQEMACLKSASCLPAAHALRRLHKADLLSLFVANRYDTMGKLAMVFTRLSIVQPRPAAALTKFSHMKSAITSGPSTRQRQIPLQIQAIVTDMRIPDHRHSKRMFAQVINIR